MRNIAAAILTATLMAPTAAAQPDPCTLLTATEVTAALGSAATGGTPRAPRTAKGGTSRRCQQQVGKATLSINVVEFASAAAADQGLTLVLKEAQDIPEAMKLEPAPGVGDRSAFGTNPMGAMWVAIKSKYMLAITVMGESGALRQLFDQAQNCKASYDSACLREPLKRLTAAGLMKLAP